MRVRPRALSLTVAATMTLTALGIAPGNVPTVAASFPVVDDFEVPLLSGTAGGLAPGFSTFQDTLAAR